jgi:hypothetical protein
VGLTSLLRRTATAAVDQARAYHHLCFAVATTQSLLAQGHPLAPDGVLAVEFAAALCVDLVLKGDRTLLPLLARGDLLDALAVVAQNSTAASAPSLFSGAENDSDHFLKKASRFLKDRCGP